MKKIASFHDDRLVRPLLSVLWIIVSLLIAALCGLFLFGNAIFNGLASAIVSTGIDLGRSQFIAALILTAGAALAGALLGRRRLGAFLGASFIFWFDYLAGFIQTELQPIYDPGGQLEPLNSGALFTTSLTMIALALLSAFIGAAVGAALGEVLLDPFEPLIRGAWRRFGHQRGVEEASTEGARTASRTRVIASWLGVGGMVAALALASGSGNLFIFAPDIGLHNPPPLQSTNGLPTNGSVVQDSLVSPALGGKVKPFLVYLPPSYNTPQGRTKRYPTLYLLHGSPGKDVDWILGGKATESADTLIDEGKIPELIMVFPDGNGRPGATSEWGNSFDQHQLIETYVAVDLVRYVDKHYRTIPDAAHRAIGGLSMGGFGAMNIALHHPDVFGTVISLGGYYQAEGTIWGHNIAYMQLNSPADVLPHDPAAWKLHIYLGAATRDQPYYRDTIQFMHELRRLHIPYRFDLQIGYHSWRVWQVQMYNALSWIVWG